MAKILANSGQLVGHSGQVLNADAADCCCGPQPPDTGACCLPDGSCVPGITQAACDAQSGTWFGNINCQDAQCNPTGCVQQFTSVLMTLTNINAFMPLYTNSMIPIVLGVFAGNAYLPSTLSFVVPATAFPGCPTPGIGYRLNQTSLCCTTQYNNLWYLPCNQGLDTKILNSLCVVVSAVVCCSLIGGGETQWNGNITFGFAQVSGSIIFAQRTWSTNIQKAGTGGVLGQYTSQLPIACNQPSVTIPQIGVSIT